VEDGAAAYLLLAEELHCRPQLRGMAFNFSNESQVTVLALVNRILRAMGSNLEPDIRNEASHEIRQQYLNASRARQTLNWSPLFTLEQGIDRTISWYREFLA
jgi:CDP-glucose 4,6-dehydratase